MTSFLNLNVFASLQTLEIRHLAGLICKTLDLALTPRIIKSGFRATGIVPFNPDTFNEADYVEAVEHEADDKNQMDENEQRRIVVLPDPVVGQVEKAPQPSTSSVSGSTSVDNFSILKEVGPLQGEPPKKPSNRGRKPM